MSIERDSDGFLVNMNDWTEEVMEQMAKDDGFDLTPEKIMYINKAREMFEKDGVVPPIRVFAKEFGLDRKAKALYDLFESGPMKKIAKYGGLAKPTGCV